MASNPPPFQVEDTDEDFFDKLVEDDLGPARPTQPGPKISDSDDAKAFANLGIGDSVADSIKKVETESGRVGSDAAVSSQPEVESDSFGFDSVVEEEKSNESEKAVESGSDPGVSKGNDSGNTGVKEVDWGSFYANSGQNGSSHGFGSYSDFFNELGDNNTTNSNNAGDFPANLNTATSNANANATSGVNSQQYHGGATSTSAVEAASKVEPDVNSTEYWESLYPGWKYDSSTGQWYQVDSFNAGIATDSNWATVVADTKTEVSYLQQPAHTVAGTVTAEVASTTGSLSSWDQLSHGTNGYPEHMVFNAEYPGWYYDTIEQEWRSLEAYNASVQSAAATTVAPAQNGGGLYGEYRQADSYGAQGVSNQGQDGGWSGSYGSYNPQGSNVWQPENVATSESFSSFGGNQQLGNAFGSAVKKDQQTSVSSFGAVPSYNKASQGRGEANGTVGFQSFIPGGNFNQQYSQGNVKLNEQTQFADDYYGGQKPVNYSQQPVQSSNQFPYAQSVGRSSAGRPPHALVTFGFGGKLIVMKDNSGLRNSSYGSQDPVADSVSVLNLTEVFMQKPDASSFGMTTCDYFRALCQQSFPGPLVGGNVGSKELNKWIDERIANCESPDTEFRKGKVLRLLLSLLKIACQHYGKLRSPFGADTLSKENDAPESAVAKLFASAKSNDAQFSEYGDLSHCVQKLPSEGQIRATASEVQNLLVSGRKKEALQCAQEGQLWGPALVLASQLGQQFYVDTVKQMALCQLIAGSPLRTLCLLIAGQPAEVFSADTTSEISYPGAINTPQQPAQFGSNKMLDDWEENLAVITANRTKDDELVIIHLGDTLWKDRSEITAAHICYLIAEANFESYSDTARLCLIGADHWKLPRTYASPEAIQRTELYEYSKVLGNSQFILLPFQPYKLIYAHMLAEVGRVSDSLKYCQIILKSLKTVRAPEAETWKQLVSSLEDRIRTHQQGGYSVNLVSTFKGKLLNFFDSTAHRVVGGLPPPAPSTSQGSVHGNENYQQPLGPRGVSTSQSTMAMSSLVPSSSMEPISDYGSRKPMHNRSVSEPDFGSFPRQVDSSKEITSPDGRGKVSGSPSRFSRFGFGSQLLQKTVGLVLGPRSGKQAKLGETNKFYYDEKLKRWVEEGAAPPAEEPALAPPPTTTAFQNGGSDYNLRSALKKDGSPTKGGPELQTSTPAGPTSGTPPIPPSSNQFSARGRMGIRSRYVDTFNQGGGMPANSFQSPSVPSVKPAVAANAKFFIPTIASAGEQGMEAISENVQEDGVAAAANEDPSTSSWNDSFHTPPPSSSSSMTMQRYPSMGNIQTLGVQSTANGPLPPHSRRTASWGGSANDVFSPPKAGEIKPLGEALGMPPALFRPTEPPSMMRMPMNGGGSFGDLQEVEL